MLRFLSQSKKENLGIFPTLRGPETKSLTRIFSIISYTRNDRFFSLLLTGCSISLKNSIY